VTHFATRVAELTASCGPLCVGIDPSAESLAGWGLVDSADGALELGRVLLAEAQGRVGIVKPQVGYFERFGAAGYSVLETLIQEARSAGLLVIADVKRGDIGSTMESYSSAWLETGPLQCEAMTVSPYPGFDALESAFRAAELSGGAVFVLCATSNPDAPTVQSASTSGETVSALIARRARERSGTTQTVGVVVGATRSLESSGVTEDDLDGLLVLAPGFGAQGAALSDVTTIFGAAAPRVIPTVSRSVLRAGPTEVGVMIENHLRELGF
jgi:orotidine-5'-phosphate decarboxylase